MTGTESRYWDGVAEAWQKTRPQTLWRRHSDAVNLELLARWLPQQRVARLLKTDVFDEAFGEGLYPLLELKAEQGIGMDLSVSTVHAARTRYASLRGVGADARCLPFANDTFDVIVSISTLDHYRSRAEIV
ncbi:MAG: methyltransferase domain-containing protein, partial [Candidatus Binatia bacterium]